MPKNDPGDGEFDDDPFVIDFMRDLSNVGYDDAVVDIIGSGADVEHAKPSRDQELTDMLSAWRNDVDREPLNLDLPSDQTERGALPQAPTTGGTLVSVSESIGQFRMLANQVPSETVQAADGQLEELLGQGMALLGQIPAAQQFAEVVGAARAEVADLAARMNHLKMQIEEIADAMMGS